MRPFWSEDSLWATVERLAASPTEQTAYLEESGVAPSADELALEFSDEFQRVKEQDSPAVRALHALDSCLSEMSGPENSALWNTGSLADTRWDRVRDLAGDALDARETAA